MDADVDAVPATGRKARTGNYFMPEKLNLLAILKRRLPIGSEEWHQCADEHALQYPGCCQDSIRRKCNSLYRKKTPTGDSNCPEDVNLQSRSSGKLTTGLLLEMEQKKSSVLRTLHSLSLSWILMCLPVIAAPVCNPSLDDDSDDEEPVVAPTRCPAQPKKRA